MTAKNAISAASIITQRSHDWVTTSPRAMPMPASVAAITMTTNSQRRAPLLAGLPGSAGGA